MKQDIHPEYGPVVFRDRTGNLTFMTKSTLVNDPRYTETITWEDGNEYKLIDVDTSSASHPFYTGKRTARGRRTEHVCSRAVRLSA